MAEEVDEPCAQPAAEQFDVVVNDEDQYSIWRVGMTIPDGWKAVGLRGSQQECLDHIREVWTDMRPRSLREAMAADSLS